LVVPIYWAAAGCGGSTDGVDCAPEEKSCLHAGESRCVSRDAPEYGCGRESCAPCNLQKASSFCAEGACAIAGCEVGFEDCDADHTNGCEINLFSDESNCGSCDFECPDPPNAFAACSERGTCGIARCGTGFQDCDGAKTSGCEVDSLTDPDHCGECGNACAGDCVDGECE
jgi:hypothetical protein